MKKLLIVILFLSGCAQSKLGGPVATIYTEVPAVITTRVGQHAFATFVGKDTQIVPMTVQEYLNLALPDAKPPELSGYTFQSASLIDDNVSSAPVLQDNQYYVVGKDASSSTLVEVKKPGEAPQIILKTGL